jgi:hypothetical protein
MMAGDASARAGEAFPRQPAAPRTAKTMHEAHNNWILRVAAETAVCVLFRMSSSLCPDARACKDYERIPASTTTACGLGRHAVWSWKCETPNLIEAEPQRSRLPPPVAAKLGILLEVTMLKNIRQAGVGLVFAGGLISGAAAAPPKVRVEPFDLSQVRLLDGFSKTDQVPAVLGTRPAPLQFQG